MPIVKCRICTKDFYVKPNHQKLGWGKYCSRKCQAKSQFNGKFVHCFICNKEVYRSLDKLNHSKSGKYFCTRTCQTNWRNSIYIEERSANWKNGKRSYRKMLFRRDLIKKCVLCDIKDKRLIVVHHKDSDRSNNDISNLSCLCLNCHFLVHHDEELNKKVSKIYFKT